MRFSGSAQNRRAAFGRRDAEFERLKKERDELLIRERAARAEAEERKRISRELHDRVAHSMGVVHQSLELYEVFKEGKPSQAKAKMKLARETTQEALDLTRNISRELHNMKAGDGLSTALSDLLKTAVPPGLESSISVEGDESLIPPRIREQLFLILREAVRNVVSHSGASRLGIEVKVSPERVVGRVEDDGRGFRRYFRRRRRQRRTGQRAPLDEGASRTCGGRCEVVLHAGDGHQSRGVRAPERESRGQMRYDEGRG